jgi:hypothetical protein
MDTPRPSYALPSLRAFALAALAALAQLAIAASPTVALVTDVVGDARHDGEPLKLLQQLPAGRDVVLGESASAVLFFVNDGGEWTLRGPGRYRLGNAGVTAADGATRAEKRAAPAPLRDLRLRPDRLRQAAVILRGNGGSDLRLVSPAHGDLVLDDGVTLAWEMRDARDVQFEVEVVDSAGERVLRETTTAQSLAWPASVPLRAGERYTWAVRTPATRAGQPLYRASEFVVATPRVRQRVQDARPGAQSRFSERVLFVALLDEIGATSEAARMREALAAERSAGWAP